MLLYLHGGGYVAGSIRYAAGFAGVIAAKTGVRTLCIAYRLAPEHPFPAALDDAMTAYQYLLGQGYHGSDITLIGESAGGGLILSLCLLLKAQGIPLPARLVAISPWTDLTLSGESMEENREVDISLTKSELAAYAACYAPEQAALSLVSPLWGDLTGLPPCAIYVGGDEILLDDSRRLCTRLLDAGLPATISIEPGMWHAYLLYGVPEANAAWREIKTLLEG